MREARVSVSCAAVAPVWPADARPAWAPASAFTAWRPPLAALALLELAARANSEATGSGSALPDQDVPGSGSGGAARPRTRRRRGEGRHRARTAAHGPRIVRLARIIFDSLGADATMESEIRAAFGNTPDTSKALRLCAQLGAVERLGRGGRPDPFVYRRVAAKVPPGLCDAGECYASSSCYRE